MRSTTATLCPASSRISAEPRRLVGGEDDPRALLPPCSDGTRQPPGAAEWQDRLAPSEQVARATRPTGHRDVGGRLRIQVSSSVRDATRRPFQSRGAR